MNIGIINMYGLNNGMNYIIQSLNDLEYCPIIYDYSSEIQIFDIINSSDIKFWIFSGSPCMVVDVNSPIVPMNILNLDNKKFMLICYSMESVLYQLGLPVKKRYENKDENFNLTIDINKIKEINKTNIFLGLTNKLKVRRNHYYYIPSNLIKNDDLKLVSSYRKESMIIFYKNSLLVQFHPERTSDGYKLIKNWIMN